MEVVTLIALSTMCVHVYKYRVQPIDVQNLDLVAILKLTSNYNNYYVAASRLLSSMIVDFAPSRLLLVMFAPHTVS